MPNILLIDDHELFREGLKLLLADLTEDIVFAEASSCEAALGLTAQDSYQIVLLDLHLPGRSGLQALQAVREAMPAAVLVVLSGEEDPRIIRQVIECGAAGFVPKSSTHAVMTAALRLVLAGGSYLPAQVLCGAPESPTPPANVLSNMTLRQVEALRLAMQGKANKVIAREMAVSEATVKAHLAACFRTLGVKNRTEAVFAAARAGITV